MKQAIFGLLVLFAVAVQAQQDSANAILFTFGDDAVTADEFRYVYRKNNPDKSFDEQDVRDYLDLYINFKLKVKDAEEAKVDTIPQVRHELTTYQKQLVDSYIEKEVMDQTLKELYGRMQQDRNISHIFINVPSDSPEDTLKAYQKIMDIRKRLIRGEDFTKVALQTSEDPNLATNSGNLGWITFGGLPVHIEDAVYETAKGKVTMPVRSEAGYHLIKVNETRPAVGTVQVAHILLRANEAGSEDQEKAALQRATDIWNRLNEGEDFEGLAKMFSEDGATKDRGGVLDPFGVGNMVTEFEEVAFGLENPGDYSKPVKTQYGYHIIQLKQKQPVPQFEDVRDQLEQVVKQPARYQQVVAGLVNQYQEEYSFIEFPQATTALMESIDTSLLSGNFVSPSRASDEVLFALADREFTQSDFLNYLEKNQHQVRGNDLEEVVKRQYEEYKKNSILNYGLDAAYPEFSYLKQEYHDGIIMFEMMEQQVWNRAVTDTAGLQAYYEANKTDHMWGQRVDVDVFTVADEKTAKKVLKKARKKTNEWLLEKYNDEDEEVVLSITNGLYAKGQNPAIDSLTWAPGWSEMIIGENGKVTLYRINSLVEPMPKQLEEARGLFIADYQDYLEQQWKQELKKKYAVRINEEVLGSLFD